MDLPRGGGQVAVERRRPAGGPSRSRPGSASRRGRAPRSGARPCRARPPGRSRRARRPRARGSCPARATRSRWMRTPSHSSSRRSLSTTTSVPSAASSASRSASRVLDGRDPVAALARLGGVGAVVLDQRGAARGLLAQLQAAVAHAEVGVALDEDPAVLGAELQADLQRALRVGVGRLELDVAAGRGHRRESSSSATVRGRWRCPRASRWSTTSCCAGCSRSCATATRRTACSARRSTRRR